jgi:excisionase family DNA binding protein
MPEARGLPHVDIPQAEPALRTAEVARALGVSARAVRTWADDGKIACHRTFGGHRLFNVSEIRRVLASWGGSDMAVLEAVPATVVVVIPAGDREPVTDKRPAQDERGNADG